MNKQELITDIEGKAFIYKIINIEKVAEHADGTKVYHCHVIEKSENIGMQTFDLHLQKLYEQGKITLEDALANSDSPNNLRLKISLSHQNVTAQAPEIEAAAKKLPELNIEMLDLKLDD